MEDIGKRKTNSTAVLITVHNRWDMTENLLNKLLSMDELNFDIYLVDDGSTDGTTEKIQQHYSEVSLIKGSGSLFWAGGMRLAWKEASTSGDYKGFLWLNNDVDLFEQNFFSWVSMLPQEVVSVGKLSSSYGNVKTYGLKTTASEVLMNGNCVYVPNKIFEKIGGLRQCYTHGFADYDYGHRLTSNRIEILESENFVGLCDRNEIQKAISSEYFFRERLQALREPTDLYLYDYLHYLIRNYRIHTALLRLAKLILRVTKPSIR